MPKGSVSPALLPCVQIVHSLRKSRWPVLILRSEKRSLFYQHCSHLWHPKCKTDWTLHDNSHVSFKFKVQSLLWLQQMSVTQWPLPIWDLPDSSPTSALIMMCLDAWIQIVLTNLWTSVTCGMVSVCTSVCFLWIVAYGGNSSTRTTVCIQSLGCLNTKKRAYNTLKPVRQPHLHFTHAIFFQSCHH